MKRLVSDRERLTLALDELRRHGYFTSNPASLWCCGTCARHEVPEDVPGYVVWHRQSDDSAFAYGYRQSCSGCQALWPDSDLDPDSDAKDDDSEERYATEYAHILECHGALRSDLYLLWGGDVGLIVRTLRSQGLEAEVPADERRCIKVRPRWSAS